MLRADLDLHRTAPGLREKVLTRTVRGLAEHVRAGGLVVALEPSCTAVFRADVPPRCSPATRTCAGWARRTVTLSELLTEHSPATSRRRGCPTGLAKALAQVHCHQHAIMGWEADRELLRRAGVDAERLDSGCCGLAGNFGF